jgi:hypothetical protein
MPREQAADGLRRSAISRLTTNAGRKRQRRRVVLEHAKGSLGIAAKQAKRHTGLREIAEMFAQNFTILRGCARQIARNVAHWSL